MEKRYVVIVLLLIAVLLMYMFPLSWGGAGLMSVAIWLFLLPSKHRITHYQYTTLAYTRLQNAVYDKQISIRSALHGVIALWLFPTFLAIYLIYLLVMQTQLFDLHFTRFFLAFDESVWGFLLGVSAVLAMTFPAHRYTAYLSTTTSAFWGGIYVLLPLLFALVGVVVIRKETIDLGWIAHAISMLTGVVLTVGGFLVYRSGEEEIVG